MSTLPVGRQKPPTDNYKTHTTMKKMYVKPTVKEKTIDLESLLASESNTLNGDTPVSGLPTNTPTMGGTSDASPSPGAKCFDVWGADDEEE